MRTEAWPQANFPDECHDALLVVGGVTEVEAQENGWLEYLETLAGERRACRVHTKEGSMWTAAERLDLWQLLHPKAHIDPVIDAVSDIPAESIEIALAELLRLRLQGTGPVTEQALADFVGVSVEKVCQGLTVLEAEGFAMRGQFEQELNAFWMAKLNYGINLRRIRSEAVGNFLYRLPDYKEKLNQYHAADNTAIKAKLGELLENNCALAKKFHFRRKND